MTDVEAGQQWSDTLKCNGSASQNSEIGDDVVMTVTEINSERNSREQSFVRQTSKFENKESQELMRPDGVDVSSNCNTCDNLTENKNSFIKSGNSCAASKTRVNTTADSSSNVKHSRAQNRSAKSTSDEGKKKKSWRNCNCIFHGFSMLLSVMAIAGMFYMYYTRNNTVESVTEPSNIDTFQGQSSALQGHSSSRKIAGRFKLDRDAFSTSNKTQIRWKSATETNNLITASPDGPCLIVPERGTYGVFSVLTFFVEKDDTVTKLAHYMRLYGFQTGEQFFKRKIIKVPVPENRNNPELIQSTIISFPSMEANGSICLNTADGKMKYLYGSPIDNTIDIFKV